MKIKVLIVDDEAHVRNVMQLKLRQAGFEVTVASDGEEALDRARESRPDVLISDLQMPLMSGLQLCRAIERDPITAGIPTILLTSREFEIGPQQLQGTSVRQVIGKPFSPRQIVQAATALATASGQRL